MALVGPLAIGFDLLVYFTIRFKIGIFTPVFAQNLQRLGVNHSNDTLIFAFGPRLEILRDFAKFIRLVSYRRCGIGVDEYLVEYTPIVPGLSAFSVIQ
jgi:hypothetical protein